MAALNVFLTNKGRTGLLIDYFKFRKAKIQSLQLKQPLIYSQSKYIRLANERGTLRNIELSVFSKHLTQIVKHLSEKKSRFRREKSCAFVGSKGTHSHGSRK